MAVQVSTRVPALPALKARWMVTVNDTAHAEVDVDRDRALALKLRVESVPVLLLAGPDGRELRRLPGYMPASQLRVALNKALTPGAAAKSAPDIARRLAEAYVHLGRYAEAAAVGKEWGITVDGLPLNKKTGGARPATPLTLVPSADTTPVDHDVPAIALAIHYYFTFQQRYPENDLADDALYWAATAYAKLGLVDQAEEILEKSLALYPNGDMHTYTKRLYEQLTTRFGSPEPVF